MLILVTDLRCPEPNKNEFDPHLDITVCCIMLILVTDLRCPDPNKNEFDLHLHITICCLMFILVTDLWCPEPNKNEFDPHPHVTICYMMLILVTDLRCPNPYTPSFTTLQTGVLTNLYYVTNLCVMPEFQTLNCRFSFGIQPMWLRFCVAIVTRYDLLS